MPGSYTYLRYHMVWSTHERRPLIHPTWKSRLYDYMGAVLRNKGGSLLEAGGTADHVHVVASLPPAMAVASAANALKANSSRWVHQSCAHGAQFNWQEGYSAFTVSRSGEPSVLKYARGQEEHHQTRGFKEELMALLQKHGIAYDEEHLWG